MNATMFMPPHDMNIPKEKFGQVIDSIMYIREQLSQLPERQRLNER